MLIPEFGMLVGAGDPGPARHGAQIQADRDKPTSRQADKPPAPMPESGIASIGDRISNPASEPATRALDGPNVAWWGAHAGIGVNANFTVYNLKWAGQLPGG
jgi:hypothetical protein